MKCWCGTHELTKEEKMTLPEQGGYRFCFISCIMGYRAKRDMKLKQYAAFAKGDPNGS